MGYFFICFEESELHFKAVLNKPNGTQLGHDNELGLYDEENDVHYYDEDVNGTKVFLFVMNVDDCSYEIDIEVSDLEGNLKFTR